MKLFDRIKGMLPGRKVQVLYTAPGFLAGTYMYTGKDVTQVDLVRHAIRMKYGAKHTAASLSMLMADPMHVNIVVKEIWR